MKTLALVALLSMAAICLAQRPPSPLPHPFPLPSLNISRAEGQWYAIFFFNYDVTNFPYPFECYSINFTITGDHIQTDEFLIINHDVTKNVAHGNITNQTSVWSFGADQYAWLSMDPLNHDYALYATTNSQYAFFLARTPTVSRAVTNIQKALLMSEGYLLNSTNVIPILGQCSRTSIEIDA